MKTYRFFFKDKAGGTYEKPIVANDMEAALKLGKTLAAVQLGGANKLGAVWIFSPQTD